MPMKVSSPAGTGVTRMSVLDSYSFSAVNEYAAAAPTAAATMTTMSSQCSRSARQ